MSSNTLRKVQGTLFALSLVALGTGCKTSHPSYYATEGTPTTSTGGTQSYQTSTTQAATSETSAPTDAQGNAVIPLYQESIKVGTRTVDAGEVRLKKVVTTETVNQPVQIRRETVVIDREPASGQSSQTSQSTANAQQSGASGQAFQEQETVIHLKREEPVVETEVVPSGRIVVQRKTEPQQQSVQRQIRREDIQVQKSGNADNVIISDNLKNSARQGEATGAGGSTSSQNQGTGTSSSDTNKNTNSNSGTP